MQSFPMFHRLTGRRVVIAGGGEQAAQKARLMLKTDAQLDLLAPELEDELTAIVARGRARHLPGPVAVSHFADTALVFIATGCPGLDAALHALPPGRPAAVVLVSDGGATRGDTAGALAALADTLPFYWLTARLRAYLQLDESDHKAA